MIEELPITKKKSRREHGTLTSYIVGFGLSLVFTLIPYYLVVYKTTSGNTLLATIIGFAMLQMVVQVVFFLHLGREKKPHWNALFLVSTVGIIFVVVVGSIWIMNHLHYNMSGINVADKIASNEAVYQIEGEQTGTCPKTGTNHKVMLMDGIATPGHIDARLCDTLTFMNHDEVTREINFGSGPHAHKTYAGESGLTVRPARNKVMTLTELGTHKFHDHMLDEISGDFTVTE